MVVAVLVKNYQQKLPTASVTGDGTEPRSVFPVQRQTVGSTVNSTGLASLGQSGLVRQAFGKLPPPNFEGQILKGVDLSKVDVTVSDSLKLRGLKVKKVSWYQKIPMDEVIFRTAEAKDSTSSSQMMNVYAIRNERPEATDSASVTAMVKEFDFLNFKDFPLKVEKLEYKVGSESAYTYQGYQVAIGKTEPWDLKQINQGKYDYLRINLRSSGLNYPRGSEVFLHRQIPLTEITSDATASATSLLKERGLLPQGDLKFILVDFYPVQDRGKGGYDLTHFVFNDAAKVLYVRRVIEGFPVIDGDLQRYPEESRLGISFNKDNQIIGLYYQEFLTQIDFGNFSPYPVISEEEALNRVLSSKDPPGTIWRRTGKEDFNFALTPLVRAPADWNKNKIMTLEIDSLEKGYYRPESFFPRSDQFYYSPIYIFNGKATVQGPDFKDLGDREFEIRLLVPALRYGD